MICTCCNIDKSEYDFYSRFGKSFNVTRFFFVNPEFSVLKCWTCNGPYRCLGCGETKPASAFRVGGRFCCTCKSAGIYRVLPEAYAPNNTVVDDGSLGVVETPEKGLAS